MLTLYRIKKLLTSYTHVHTANRYKHNYWLYHNIKDTTHQLICKHYITRVTCHWGPSSASGFDLDTKNSSVRMTSFYFFIEKSDFLMHWRYTKHSLHTKFEILTFCRSWDIVHTTIVLLIRKVQVTAVKTKQYQVTCSLCLVDLPLCPTANCIVSMPHFLHSVVTVICSCHCHHTYIYNQHGKNEQKYFFYCHQFLLQFLLSDSIA